MKLKKQLGLLFFLVLPAMAFNGLAAAGEPVRSSQHYVFSPAAAGAAGIGSQIYSPFEGSIYNPAILGMHERMAGGLGYAYSPELSGYWAHTVFPGSLGGLGISAAWFNNPAADGQSLQNFGFVNLGYGKYITRSLLLGFYLRPAFGNSGSSFLGAGFDFGLAYVSHANIRLGGGFGLFNPSFYLLPRNLFVFSEAENAPGISVHTGFQSMFWQNKQMSLAAYFEVSGADSFTEMPLHTGLEYRYGFLQLRGGYIFRSNDYLFSGATAGIGTDFQFESGSLALQYGVVLPYMSREDLYHYISISGSYGKIDREPPEVNIKAVPSAFSPDTNGSQDYTYFEIEVSDDSPIRSWQLTIIDSEGRPVRTFANDTRVADESLGVSEIFSTFFTRKEYLVVPAKIRWDGTRDRVQISKTEEPESANQKLPNGVYNYRFEVEDERGNRAPAKTGFVEIDTVAPSALIHNDDLLFSPNNDGALDEFVVLHEPVAEENDTWVITIATEDNKTVFQEKYSGKMLPDRFAWDGKDNRGNDVKEGIYTYTLSGKDNAGNFYEKKITGIQLDRARINASIKLSATGISPNEDGIADTVTITPGLTETGGLQSYRVIITEKPPTDDLKGIKIIREYKGTTAEELAKPVVWDGITADGGLALDNRYYVQLRARFNTGTKPVSFARKIQVDTLPPDAGAESDVYLFSPDGDGKKEEQVFRLEIEDHSEIKNFQLNIYEVQFDEKDVKKRFIFKTYKGESEYPEKIFWDGKSNSGHLVESATLYEYELTATDIYGNTGKSSTGRFETDILVMPTDRGLKIRLSNIHFAHGSAELTKKATDLLDRLAGTLLRYASYRIRVEGHTDDIGTEVYNMKLSEKRARSVMDYLITKGINKDMLSYQGRGELYPLLPNTSWYNRSRNRRVEFLLIKD